MAGYKQRRNKGGGGNGGGSDKDSFPHQSAMEQMFDQDFSDVQVHTGEAAALSAIGAGGLASGNQIALPDSTPTLDLMAHELTHVVQQRQGGGGTQGLTSAPGDSAETEAVGNEARAQRGESIQVASGPTGQLQGDWGTCALIGGALGGLAGGPAGALLGGAVGGMIQEALSDDEEQEAAPAQATPEADTELTPRQEVERDLRRDNPDLTDDQMAQRMAGWDVFAMQDQTSAAYEDDMQTVDLSSPEARIAALDNFSQNHMASMLNEGDEEWKNMCGATNMMAAVMLGSGNEGVADLANSLASAEGLDEFWQGEYRDIAERAANGEVTSLDLMTLTQRMHTTMTDFDEANGNADEPGVTGAALAQLGQDNPAIEAAMQAGGIGMRLVDNDNDGLGNHFVLEIGEGTDDHAIYDPMAHFEGAPDQYMTDAGDIETYRTAMAAND